MTAQHDLAIMLDAAKGAAPVSIRGGTQEGRLDADAVRAVLRVTAVLARFGEEYRDRPEIRLAVCPACGQRQRRASVVIDRESGRWIHHGGATSAGTPCKGDAFDLVAAYTGLDARRDFPRVLELAAQIAGVTPNSDPTELARIRAEYRARTEARARRAAEERARGEALGADHVRVMSAVIAHGDVLMLQSRWPDAAALYERAIPILEKSQGAGDALASALSSLCRAYVELQQPVRALALVPSGSIATGDRHTCAVDAAGKVIAVGRYGFVTR